MIIGRNFDSVPFAFSNQDRVVLAIEPAEKELKATLECLYFGMVGCGLAAINSEGVYFSSDDGGPGEGGLGPDSRPIPGALLGRMAIEWLTD